MASNYFIIIDDQDKANVTVSGSANITTANPAYQDYDGTATALTGEHAEVTLQFWGTSVQEFQTMGAGVPNVLNFTLDGVHTAVNEPVLVAPGHIVPHFPIFSSPSQLSDGVHTLVSSIQTSGVTPGEGTADSIIDYYIVTRPADADVAGVTLLYDDTHPDFSYDGQWSLQSGQSVSQNMNWTLHGATAQGSTVSLDFNGSNIMIYGSIPQNSSGAIASFVVDSEPAFTASVPIPAPSASLNVSANQVLYQTSLAPGSHSIAMTALAPNMFYLDYLTVTGISKAQADSGASSSQSASSPSSTNSSTSSSTSGGGGGSGGNHTSSASHNAATIAGAVVGAFAGVAILAAILFLFYRRRRRSPEQHTYDAAPRDVPPAMSHRYTDSDTTQFQSVQQTSPEIVSSTLPPTHSNTSSSPSGLERDSSPFNFDPATYAYPRKPRPGQDTPVSNLPRLSPNRGGQPLRTAESEAPPTYAEDA